MKINRHNYEEFLLDFIEGNLPENEAEAVQSFLDKNPDIKVETEDLLSFRFDNENKIFENKKLLKKDSQVDIEGISKFERLSIAFLENDISDEDHLLLSKMLEHSETKQHEHQLIQKTRLIADEKIVFSNKSKLKQFRLFSAKRIVYFASSIAATAALLISLILINNDDKMGVGLALNNNDFDIPLVRKNVSNQDITTEKEFVINDAFVENTIVDTTTEFRASQNIESVESKKTVLIENQLVENQISTQNLIAITSTANTSKNVQTEIEVKDYVNNKLQELGVEKKENEKILLAKTGKSVGKFFGDLFRKNIQVKKFEVEDGRKLYAVRAGSLEFYTNVKSRKNKDKKPKQR